SQTEKGRLFRRNALWVPAGNQTLPPSWDSRLATAKLCPFDWSIPLRPDRPLGSISGTRLARHPLWMPRPPLGYPSAKEKILEKLWVSAWVSFLQSVLKRALASASPWVSGWECF